MAEDTTATPTPATPAATPGKTTAAGILGAGLKGFLQGFGVNVPMGQLSAAPIQSPRNTHDINGEKVSADKVSLSTPVDGLNLPNDDRISMMAIQIKQATSTTGNPIIDNQMVSLRHDISVGFMTIDNVLKTTIGEFSRVTQQHAMKINTLSQQQLSDANKFREMKYLIEQIQEQGKKKTVGNNDFELESLRRRIADLEKRPQGGGEGGNSYIPTPWGLLKGLIKAGVALEVAKFISGGSLGSEPPGGFGLKTGTDPTKNMTPEQYKKYLQDFSNNNQKNVEKEFNEHPERKGAIDFDKQRKDHPDGILGRSLEGQKKWEEEKETIKEKYNKEHSFINKLLGVFGADPTKQKDATPVTVPPKKKDKPETENFNNRFGDWNQSQEGTKPRESEKPGPNYEWIPTPGAPPPGGYWSPISKDEGEDDAIPVKAKPIMHTPIGSEAILGKPSDNNDVQKPSTSPKDLDVESRNITLTAHEILTFKATTSIELTSQIIKIDTDELHWDIRHFFMTPETRAAFIKELAGQTPDASKTNKEGSAAPSWWERTKNALGLGGNKGDGAGGNNVPGVGWVPGGQGGTDGMPKQWQPGGKLQDEGGKVIDPATMAKIEEMGRNGDVAGIQKLTAERGYRMSGPVCGMIASKYASAAGFTPPTGGAIATSWHKWGESMKGSDINSKDRPFGSMVGTYNHGRYGGKQGQLLATGETGGHVMHIAPGSYDEKDNSALFIDQYGARRRSLDDMDLRYAGQDAVNAAKERQTSGGQSSDDASTSIGNSSLKTSKGLRANQQEAYTAARKEGLTDNAAKLLVANVSGESLSNPNDHHWDVHHMSQGIVQWDPERAESIKKQFGAYPKDMSVADQTKAALWEMKNNPRFRSSWNALNNEDLSPQERMHTLVKNYESPADVQKAVGQRMNHLNPLKSLNTDASNYDDQQNRFAKALDPTGQGVGALDASNVLKISGEQGETKSPEKTYEQKIEDARSKFYHNQNVLGTEGRSAAAARKRDAAQINEPDAFPDVIKIGYNPNDKTKSSEPKEYKSWGDKLRERVANGTATQEEKNFLGGLNNDKKPADATMVKPTEPEKKVLQDVVKSHATSVDQFETAKDPSWKKLEPDKKAVEETGEAWGKYDKQKDENGKYPAIGKEGSAAAPLDHQELLHKRWGGGVTGPKSSIGDNRAEPGSNGYGGGRHDQDGGGGICSV